MARLFNGTSDFIRPALNLTGTSVLIVSFWLYWDTNANDDDLAMEFGTTAYTAVNGFIIDPNNSVVANTVMVGMGKGSGGSAWVDRFARPSAATWHHWLVSFTRTGPTTLVWIDGVSQTLTTQTHAGTSYGNFASSNLNLMCRNGASLFGAGRMADVAIWETNTAMSAAQIAALAAGVRPELVRPTELFFYFPLYGVDSPEGDQVAGIQATVTGATATTAPGKTGVPAPVLAVAA